MSLSLTCPYCGDVDNKVLESRPDPSREAVRRRRECLKCGERWTTHEIDSDRLRLLEDALKRRPRQP